MRRATRIARTPQNPNTVFAAAGDLIGASTFESFIQKDKPTIDALNEADEWTRNNIEAVAEQLAPSIGLPPSVLAVSLKRESYGVQPINNEVIASQQRIADTFVALGLVPKPINVSDLQRKPGS